MKYIHLSIPFTKICTHLGYFGIWLHYVYVYKTIRHDWLNVRHPRNISEYIIKCILNREWDKKVSQYADKYAVRSYIQSKGLGDCLLSCYGVWSKPEDIDFDALPNKFALKANNGCGGHIFCYDKSKLNRDQVIFAMHNTMSLTKISYSFEPHYKMIFPKVYCEELMDFECQANIVDYKFMCVSGKINSVLMVYDRQLDGKYKLELRDKEWKPMDGLTEAYLKEPELSCPSHFEQMKKIACVIAADFDFVRIDLYEYHDKVYIGELTFTPQGGQLVYLTTNYLEQLYKQMISEIG